MNDDSFPDRLCVNPKSPYYDAAVLSRGVGIRCRAFGCPERDACGKD